MANIFSLQQLEAIIQSYTLIALKIHMSCLIRVQPHLYSLENGTRSNINAEWQRCAYEMLGRSLCPTRRTKLSHILEYSCSEVLEKAWNKLLYSNSQQSPTTLDCSLTLVRVVVTKPGVNEQVLRTGPIRALGLLRHCSWNTSYAITICCLRSAALSEVQCCLSALIKLGYVE